MLLLVLEEMTGIKDQKRNLYPFRGVEGKRVSRKPPEFSVDSPVFVSGVSVKMVEKLELQVMTDLGVKWARFREIQTRQGHGAFYSYMDRLPPGFLMVLFVKKSPPSGRSLAAQTTAVWQLETNSKGA